MNPLQFLRVLRARYKLWLAVVFLALAVAVVMNNLAPKQYFAETAVMVDIRSPDPISSILLPATMLPGSLGTQVDIITSDRVARKVVKMLRLDANPASRNYWYSVTEGRGNIEDWLAASLQKRVKVAPSRDSNIITIGYRSADPVFAAAVANTFAQAYVETSIELKVEPARQYARWFGDQAKALRENVEKAQTRLSEYQRESGIIVSGEGRNGEGRGGESVDFETAKLNDLTARLVAAQSETAELRNKRRSAAFDSLPEVQQNPVIVRLRGDIATLEGKLRDSAGNLGNKHPQYMRMETELAELKRRLESEIGVIASGYSSVGAVGASKQAELQAAIEVQKKKILALRGKQDDITVLIRDVETAKRAYEAVTNRLTQTSLESQATQTNISILTPAIAPIDPVFPKPLDVTLLMALGAGILLASAAVYGREILDQRVRSTNDLEDMLQLPVLGKIANVESPRLLPFRRTPPALEFK